jgi:NADH:ubiquinone oxidoreductase subunit 5 (subunit L)/multisubunit Na+/H+ antiporter MnhA subunit
MLTKSILIILIMPFGSFLSLSLMGRFFGRTGAAVVSLFCIGVAALLSCVMFYNHALTGDFLYLTMGT